jgi:hypothetical protein
MCAKADVLSLKQTRNRARQKLHAAATTDKNVTARQIVRHTAGRLSAQTLATKTKNAAYVANLLMKMEKL